MGGAHSEQKRQRLPRLLGKAGQSYHQQATHQRAADPLVAPCQGLRQVAAQHHRDTQHQLMRVGSPGQRQRQRIGAAKRKAGTVYISPAEAAGEMQPASP